MTIVKIAKLNSGMPNTYRGPAGLTGRPPFRHGIGGAHELVVLGPTAVDGFPIQEMG